MDSPTFEAAAKMPIPAEIDREHGIKYAYACLQEYEFRRDDRYLEEIAGFKREGLIPASIALGV